MSDTNIKVMIPVTQGSNSNTWPKGVFDVVVSRDGEDIIFTRPMDIEPYVRFSKRDLDAALSALRVPDGPVYR